MMSRLNKTVFLAIFAILSSVITSSYATELADISNVETKNVNVRLTKFKGSDAIVLDHQTGSTGFGANAVNQEGMMIWNDVDFSNGSIELDIASELQENAPGAARGFVGLAFRVEGADDYEGIYLRPTNGRANDQLRRNHAVQYISHPDFPWNKLRKETPGKYETYVDLELGQWTSIRVVVVGTTAKLFVHSNEQPTLLVNDLKRGESRGSIALWVGIGTTGYFKDIQVN